MPNQIQRPNHNVDEMLHRTTRAIDEAIYNGTLDQLRAKFRLERILDSNRRADFELRRVFAPLHKPTPRQIEMWLRRRYTRGTRRGIQKSLLGLLATKNWTKGPHSVAVTRVTAESLFISAVEMETELAIRTNAKKEGLKECPDWVVPALCIRAEKEGADTALASLDLRLCLASDRSRGTGLSLRYCELWELMPRQIHSDSWTPGTWLFVKPAVPVFDP